MFQPPLFYFFFLEAGLDQLQILVPLHSFLILPAPSKCWIIGTLTPSPAFKHFILAEST